MLAARDGEDHRRAGPNGPVERDVGRGVAGVQADDEIDAVERVVAGDVADLEAKAFGAELSGQRLAAIDHVRLEVEPDDLDLATVHGREEMMEREREIGLARAEVDDPQPSLPGRAGQHVLDELEEAVDLAELVVALSAHLALGRHHAELDEERHGHAFGQHAPLRPIVNERDATGRVGARRRIVAPLPHREHLPVRIGRLEQALAELFPEQQDEAVRRRPPASRFSSRRSGRVMTS